MPKEVLCCIEFNECKFDCEVSIVRRTQKSSDGAMLPCAESLERLHGGALAFSADALQWLCSILQGENRVVEWRVTIDTVSEWLRRWTRHPLGSARRGSNPLGVVCAESTAVLH